MKFEFTHLKRGGVPVAQQVTNQITIFTDFLGADAIRDARCLHDGSIGPHVIDDANETIIQNREFNAEDVVELNTTWPRVLICHRLLPHCI